MTQPTPPAGAHRSALAIALFAGFAHTAAFAPLNLWWLQPLALAALLLSCRGAPAGRGRRHAALCGLAFGFAWFVSGVAWVYVSMHRYGGMPAPMAGAALMLFAAYLGAFAAASLAASARALQHAFAGPSARALLTAALCFAACWGAGEMLRGWLFTGFPWLSSGYAHTDGPLAGLAPIVGVHGVGMLAALVAAGLAFAIAAAWDHRRARNSARPAAAAAPAATTATATATATATGTGTTPATGRGAAFGAAAALVLLPLLVGAALSPIRWAEETGEPIRVRLVQGNVPQQMKFEPETVIAAMRAYAAAIAAEPPTDLVVLPETAWTVSWSRTPVAIAQEIVAGLGARGGIAAIGMPLPAETRDGRPTLANSVAAIGGDGPLDWRYDKRHLVPFGEFVPPGFGWFVRMMEIPLGDFGRGGPRQPALAVGDQRLGFNICYEDIFGEELAPQVRGGATILVNVSNIAWFGDSHALPQHLQIARMRAIELARPMLRATNTGMTASIDARGRVLAVLPTQAAGSLDAELRGTVGLTPFARFGMLAPLAALAVMAAGFVALRRR